MGRVTKKDKETLNDTISINVTNADLENAARAFNNSYDSMSEQARRQLTTEAYLWLTAWRTAKNKQ